MRGYLVLPPLWLNAWSSKGHLCCSESHWLWYTTASALSQKYVFIRYIQLHLHQQDQDHYLPLYIVYMYVGSGDWQDAKDWRWGCNVKALRSCRFYVDYDIILWYNILWYDILQVMNNKRSLSASQRYIKISCRRNEQVTWPTKTIS